MNFEDALKAMREGKHVRSPNGFYILSIFEKLYYDYDSNRPVEILPSDHILSEDWEIVE